MKTFFQILSMLFTFGAMGLLIYTYFKENKDDDIVFGYHKSLFIRDCAICAYNLALIFLILADILK